MHNENSLLEITKALSHKIILDAQLVGVKTPQTHAVINPATLAQIGTLPVCTKTHIDKAVDSAKKAQRTWAKCSASKRATLVRQASDAIAAQASLLADIMSFETGKALLTESRIEAQLVSEIFNYYAGLALEIKGETIPYDPHILTMTLREPLGVIAAIIPWNVPLMLMAVKIAPALIAGNTVVLKPSPEASLVVLKTVDIMNHILPAGVINVVLGDADTGALLVEHPDINKVAFTGSVESGRAVYQSAARKIIPVTLELGGKSPIIICEDVAIEPAAQRIVEGMRFTRQGQSCTAASRILVHKSIEKPIVDAVIKKLNALHIGDPLDEKTDIGTIISQQQFDKIQSFITLAENDSTLTLHYGSALPTDFALQKGLFLRPCLITGIKNTHTLCQQEIFGPITCIITWEDFQEAIAIANDTTFGLAAGIFTQDISRALQAAHQLDAGFVQINQYQVFRPSMPFGGFKHSGLGKEASARAMLDNYTKEKTILINMGLS